MTNIFRNIETGIVFVCIVGLALRLFELQFADLLLMIGMLSLSFFYLFTGLAFNQKELKKLSPVRTDTELTGLAKGTTFIAFLGMSVACVGILFRLLHWPGWQPQLMSGCVGSIVGLIGSYFIIRVQEPKVHQIILYRVGALIPISLVLINQSL